MSDAKDLVDMISANCDVLINDFPQTYVESGQFDHLSLQQLALLVLQATQTKDNETTILGLVGQSCINLIPIISFFQRECVSPGTQSTDSTRVPKILVKLFVPFIDIDALNAKWLTEHSTAANLSFVQQNQKFYGHLLADITGIQRIHLNEQLIIDLHIGSIPTQLSQTIPQQTALIEDWIISSSCLPSEMTAGAEQHRDCWNEATFWQIARLSQDDAQLFWFGSPLAKKLQLTAACCGLSLAPLRSNTLTATSIKAQTTKDEKTDSILLDERTALKQSLCTPYQYCHAQRLLEGKPAVSSNKSKNRAGSIAVIGGGLASANLALSLAERGKKITLFCQDEKLAKAASGNRQGALYPLLTPQNNALSQFFQQAFLYSRQRIATLHQQGYSIGHDFCGVLQTGHDERSEARINKILHGTSWSTKIANAVTAHSANQLAQLIINKPGIYYPLGGWVCPHEFTQAAWDKAQYLQQSTTHFNSKIKKIVKRDGQWYLIQENPQQTEWGPFNQLVIASGHGLNQLEQTKHLAATGFRGQVSHVPTSAVLSQLSTVLCSHGYMTPQYQGLHCIGASYIKNSLDETYSEQEQIENKNKITQSYAPQKWPQDLNIAQKNARVGVRMVTRDHAPMMGAAPDVAQIFNLFNQQQAKPRSNNKTNGKIWQQTPAPIHESLYVLGGLGSRGICSGPLAAELLAAQLCNESLPTNYETLALLDPNRMWLRKLIKGKAI